MARTVNTTQVAANWLIAREIVEEEQQGKRRAGYGEQLLEDLSIKLTREYGGGFSVQNLLLFRQFYQTYPLLIIGSKIRYALSSEYEPIIIIKGEKRKKVEGRKKAGRWFAV